MKRRISLSLHWKSYFINLIWKCKAVWNAGFSLTVLLNMYESLISWCVTLFIQRFLPELLPRSQFAHGVWQTERAGYSALGLLLGWGNMASGGPWTREENSSAYFSPASSSGSAVCIQTLFVYLGTRKWNGKEMQGTAESLYAPKPSEVC